MIQISSNKNLHSTSILNEQSLAVNIRSTNSCSLMQLATAE